MTDAIDLKKTLDGYRPQRGRFRVLDVPDQRYLMVDGHGDPNTSPDFAGAVEALYPVAYALKLANRRELARDYVVPPLEGLWWAQEMESFTGARDKSQWDPLSDLYEKQHPKTFHAESGLLASGNRLLALGTRSGMPVPERDGGLHSMTKMRQR